MNTIFNVLNQVSARLASTHCDDGSFLFLRSWHEGLGRDSACGVSIGSLSEIWLIVANITIILLQVAGLIAVGMVIYGGIRYMVSQGQPDSLQAAKKIITNALIGLAVAILASTIVGFIAGLF